MVSIPVASITNDILIFLVGQSQIISVNRNAFVYTCTQRRTVLGMFSIIEIVTSLVFIVRRGIGVGVEAEVSILRYFKINI